MGKKASFEELVNRSVNQSARRTLITTITTVMALGVLCIVAKLYGLDSIFTFAFPLMMGHDQRRVHFAVRFHLGMDAVERAQPQVRQKGLTQNSRRGSGGTEHEMSLLRC